MSGVIEILSSEDEDKSEIPKATSSTTTNNTTTMNENMRGSSGIKRANPDEQSPTKKRLKPNHVSPHVSHPSFRNQVIGKPARAMLGETLMVFDSKARNVVYQKPPAKQNEFVIADVRSFGSIEENSNKDPLSIAQPLPPSKSSVALPILSEVAIIPLKSPQKARSGVNNRTTPSSPSTSTSAPGQNGYTTTPDITIRSVPRITSPVPGSSRTSSMSSPGAASSTSMNASSHADVPKKDEPPPARSAMNQTFKDLLDVCKSADQSKEMDLITTKLVKYYRGVHPDFVNSQSFKKSVEKATNDIKSQPAQVFVVLKTIVDELKIRQGGTKITEDGEIVTENDEAVTTGDPKTDRKLYKLNRCLYITQKRIEKLNEQDAMWEDENNSSYLMIARFEKRAVQIYEKICDLTGESKNAHRRVKKPIKFNKTKYKEFNKTLQSFYNRTHNFPDFFDVLKLLDHCNTQHDYGLKGETLKIVAQSAFQELGEKLQGRRKLEEYESLAYFSSLAGDDPANHDPELARKLEANKKYHTRIDDVINKYAEGRHLEAKELLMGSSKRARLNNGASDDDSGNDEGDNPPELLNGSNPSTPQNPTNDTDNNNISTNDTPKTSLSPLPETSLTISDPSEISMEPELLSLDNVSLLNSASSMQNVAS